MPAGSVLEPEGGFARTQQPIPPPQTSRGLRNNYTLRNPQCGSASPGHTEPSITPDPCRDAHDALRQNTQTQTAGGCTHLSAEHMCSHLPSCRPPPPHTSLSTPPGTPTADPRPLGENYQFTLVTYTGPDTQMCSPMYKRTHVQADSPLPVTPLSCSGAADGGAHSSAHTGSLGEGAPFV